MEYSLYRRRSSSGLLLSSDLMARVREEETVEIVVSFLKKSTILSTYSKTGRWSIMSMQRMDQVSGHSTSILKRKKDC